MSDPLIEVGTVCFSNIDPSAFKNCFVYGKAKYLHLEIFIAVNAFV